ncbi:MAG TPA: hypothetical protein VHU13_05105 [Solirubrobacteraceae bacterium]|nr:hypothetical protein [Solirubrobacteraceae bacterium]
MDGLDKLSAQAVANMAAKDKIGKATENLRGSDYLKRLLEDEQLRTNLLAAYASARSAYGRVSNGKPAGKALLEDRKLQRELAQAANALKEASNSIRQSPAKARRKKGGLGRTLLLLLVGGALALALSEDLRSKVLDLLFGAEEEFDYSSTTMPAEAAPEPESAPAA